MIKLDISNFSVDKTIPPNGVALPVRLVFPAEIVIWILHVSHVFRIIAHSDEDFGFTSKSAFPPDIFDQSLV